MRDDPGKMRHRLTIQKLTVKPDEKCEQVEIWEEHLTVHFFAGDYHGSEKVKARQEVTEGSMAFTVRYSPKTSVMNEEDFRIVYKGEIYNILLIDDPKLMHEKLVILAQKVV